MWDAVMKSAESLHFFVSFSVRFVSVFGNLSAFLSVSLSNIFDRF